MKKKLLLAMLMIAIFACLFAISISAETPNMYIEFGARFPGSNEYITVYTENAESTGNPKIDFANKKFYSDVDFTKEVDMSTATGIDFSVAKTYVNGVEGKAPTRMTAPSSPFVNCTEVKWFLAGMPTVSYNGGFFKGWSGLKYFDFGNATAINDNTFEGCGFEELVIPATITKLASRSFANNANLKSVVFEGATELAGNACAFADCTALESVVLGNVSYIGKGTFSGCTALASIELPSTVTEIRESAFSGCTALTTVDLSGVTNMVSIGKFAFSGCTSLSKIISSGVGQDGAVIIPEGVTHIYQEAFYNCDSIKYLSLPSTITYLGPSICRDSSGLEFVDFNENPNNINLDNWGHFSGCSGLKAVSLPDNIQIINNRFMTSCTSLQAVYLPKNLVQMNTNGNGQGPFCFDKNMYFVQEPFEVRDENGNFLGDSFVMPAKPEVYYMPKTLTSAGGNASSGTWFRDCAGLNTTIVMPEVFVNSTVVQMFRETASANNIKNVVYLGNMESIAWSERNHHINFIFANPKDTDISSVTFSAFYNNLNNDCYFYFCSTGYKYTMSVAQDKIAGTKEENSYCHIVDPSKSETTKPDCVTNSFEATYCFCGADIAKTEIEGSALGHSHTVYLDLVYESFMKDGYYSYKCERCEDVNNETKAYALFACLGYSSPENGGNGLAITFTVNKDAVSKYEAKKGKISYGAFAVAKNKLGTGDVLKADGTPIDYAIKAEVSKEFTGFDLRITGFNTTEQKAILLALGAYVIYGDKISYLQDGTPLENEKYAFISYNDLPNS